MKKILLITIGILISFGAVAQKWEPIFEGSSVMFDAKSKHKKTEWKLNNGGIIRVDTWNSCLKDFIFSFPEESRDIIADGLTRLYVKYDKVDKVIRFEPVRYLSLYYAKNSYVSFVGVIDKHNIAPLLKFMYRGNDWIFLNSIKIVTDSDSYEISVEKCIRETTDTRFNSVSETFTIEYSPENESMLKDMIDSKETIVRFVGENHYSDYILKENVIEDLKAIYLMIKSIQSK